MTRITCSAFTIQSTAADDMALRKLTNMNSNAFTARASVQNSTNVMNERRIRLA